MPFDYQVLDVILPIPVESCSLWHHQWLNYPLLIHIIAGLLTPLGRTRSFSSLPFRFLRVVETAGLDFWLFWQSATPAFSSASSFSICCSICPTFPSSFSRLNCCCSITCCCSPTRNSRHFTSGVRSVSKIFGREGGISILLLDHICAPTKNSDILTAPLNQSTIGRRDINVDEGAVKMSGFIVTLSGNPERRTCVNLGNL